MRRCPRNRTYQQHLMPRPQFSLKTLLCWLVLLPAAIGCVRLGFPPGPPEVNQAWLFFAGSLVGTCVGYPLRRPVLGATLGLLIWPAFIAAGIVLAVLDIIHVD